MMSRAHRVQARILRPTLRCGRRTGTVLGSPANGSCRRRPSTSREAWERRGKCLRFRRFFVSTDVVLRLEISPMLPLPDRSDMEATWHGHRMNKTRNTHAIAFAVRQLRSAEKRRKGFSGSMERSGFLFYLVRRRGGQRRGGGELKSSPVFPWDRTDAHQNSSRPSSLPAIGRMARLGATPCNGSAPRAALFDGAGAPTAEHGAAAVGGLRKVDGRGLLPAALVGSKTPTFWGAHGQDGLKSGKRGEARRRESPR